MSAIGTQSPQMSYASLRPYLILILKVANSTDDIDQILKQNFASLSVYQVRGLLQDCSTFVSTRWTLKEIKTTDLADRVDMLICEGFRRLIHTKIHEESKKDFRKRLHEASDEALGQPPNTCNFMLYALIRECISREDFSKAIETARLAVSFEYQTTAFEIIMHALLDQDNFEHIFTAIKRFPESHPDYAVFQNRWLRELIRIALDDNKGDTIRFLVKSNPSELAEKLNREFTAESSQPAYKHKVRSRVAEITKRTSPCISPERLSVKISYLLAECLHWDWYDEALQLALSHFTLENRQNCISYLIDQFIAKGALEKVAEAILLYPPESSEDCIAFHSSRFFKLSSAYLKNNEVTSAARAAAAICPEDEEIPAPSNPRRALQARAFLTIFAYLELHNRKPEIIDILIMMPACSSRDLLIAHYFPPSSSLEESSQTPTLEVEDKEAI